MVREGAGSEAGLMMTVMMKSKATTMHTNKIVRIMIKYV